MSPRDLHDPSRDGLPLERLVDRPEAWSRLAEHVEAAESTLKRARLQPGAVDRIEARLDALDARGDGGSLWSNLRAPAYACAALALLAVAAGRFRSEPAPVAAQLARAAPRPLHLDEGTLAVGTDEVPLTVETPVARVEVAAHSQVRITVASSDVRIAASAGSARIIYYDGRTELVAPPAVPPAATTTTSSPPSAKSSAPIRVAHAHARPVASQTMRVIPSPVAPALDAEHLSFNAAMARVRPAPAEALTLLDAHLARWPDGALHEDAERVRVAVLLRLDRKNDALAALDRMSSPAPELRVVRAELRTDAGRAEEAVADFGAVLVSDDERFAARALFGRAMARQKEGDRARMTEDLERFLLLYPHGELADRARLELRRATSAAAR